LLLTAGVMLGLTVVVGLACTFKGREGFTWPWATLTSGFAWPWEAGAFANGIWKLHLSNVVVAAIVGAGLAVSGMALQGLLRNPLADPYVLGISSGAGVGYLAGLALARFLARGASAAAEQSGSTAMSYLASTTLPTLAGALVTCLLVYLLAQRRGKLDPYVLLLSGVIVNVLNGALILSMLIFVHGNDLVDYVGWGIGQIPEGLLRVQPALVAVSATAVVVGWIVVLARSSAMNVLGLGDEVASSSGVAVHGLRIETFLLVSAMTAAAVSLAGPVGFVGLIIPHICRMAVGPDHRRLAVLSGFGGAIFLIAADTFCRTAGPWFGKDQIPLGVVTAVVGGPLFILLLRRHGREGRR
jgi:iron complex transport system permease protein